MAVCKAARVEVPISERFYVKVHTLNKSRNHPNPKPTEYVVIPHPLGGRDFWVRNEDFGDEQWEEDNKEEVQKFLDKHDGSYFYIFEYSDNDGPLMCAMEHGDLFSKLPHIISNNH